MPTTTMFRVAAAVALVSLPFSTAVPQKLTGRNSTIVPPAPVPLDTTGMFAQTFAKVGDDVYLGGQPTEKALRELRAQGVTTVVNLRLPQEMTRSVSFDEAALVKSLGMKYVYLPMGGSPDFPYSPKAVRDLTAAMQATDGKLLLHCWVGWRAGHLWAAYLIEQRHVSVEDAVAQLHLTNEMGEEQPLEGFLGHAVPALRSSGHPPSPATGRN